MTVTQEQHFAFLLHLGDDALILGQRLGAWCGHGPILEEDIALTNLALDCIGQARALLTRAGQVEGKGRTEDDLAYFREEREFRNHLLLELPNGDFGDTLVRHLLYSTFAYHRMVHFAGQTFDQPLAEIAARAVKELAYHKAHAADWVIRLGDGTPESHDRVQSSLLRLWPYTGELFLPHPVDAAAAEVGLLPATSVLQEAWNAEVNAVLETATLQRPADGWMHRGGKDGVHTEHMGYLLAEMQSIARSHPGATW